MTRFAEEDFVLCSRLGTAGFLQLYALSAVTAATFSLWCTHDYFSSRSLKFFSHSPTVGASGAIAGTFAYSCMTGGSQLLVRSSSRSWSFRILSGHTRL